MAALYRKKKQTIELVQASHSINKEPQPCPWVGRYSKSRVAIIYYLKCPVFKNNKVTRYAKMGLKKTLIGTVSDRDYLFDIADKQLQAIFKELKYDNDSLNREYQ